MKNKLINEQEKHENSDNFKRDSQYNKYIKISNPLNIIDKYEYMMNNGFSPISKSNWLQTIDSKIIKPIHKISGKYYYEMKI